MVGINLKEVYEPERNRLGELFDEQVEEIKEYLINKMIYSLSKPEKDSFVEVIDGYRDAHISQKLLIAKLEQQRYSIDQSSTLLGNMVDTKTIYETLTYVLRELEAVDEDGYLLEEYDQL